jgi:NADP-dependent 3-hydroxy acid dehydrogenase YdfG
MEAHQSHQEENKEMIDMNIKEFMTAAQLYLFGLIPAPQPVLIPIPVRQGR